MHRDTMNIFPLPEVRRTSQPKPVHHLMPILNYLSYQKSTSMSTADSMYVG